MKKLILAAACAVALVFAGTAAAALQTWTYDPAHACDVASTYSDGTLHLKKNCPTATNASAGAGITGVSGTFSSASFTLASASQCQGGSPRFNVVTSDGTFFLGCNNVTPTIASNGAATYTFTAATLAAAGQQVPTPTGTIDSVDIVVDVQGTADLSHIQFNGMNEVPKRHKPESDQQCKDGRWKQHESPKFKNQGACVSYYERHHGKHESNDREHGKERS
ncbi:MAG TPA: hypothetical protein VGU02_01690 [Gaiellaceae bacterium]|nr:hypothetical protein [Gaiellaceae bacterium]